MYRELTTKYTGEEYETIAQVLEERKSVYGIREWVEMQDLYVDEKGDVYYVELYNTTYSREEGHGFHDVVDSQEPLEYALFMTADEVVLTTKKYVEQLEAEPWPLIVKVGLVAVAVSIMIIIFSGDINAWVDNFAK